MKLPNIKKIIMLTSLSTAILATPIALISCGTSSTENINKTDDSNNPLNQTHTMDKTKPSNNHPISQINKTQEKELGEHTPADAHRHKQMVTAETVDENIKDDPTRPLVPLDKTIKYNNEEYTLVDNEYKVGRDYGMNLDARAINSSNTNLVEQKTRMVTGQPYSMHFHMNDISNWKPKFYADDYFERSIVPLSNTKNGSYYKDTQARDGATFEIYDTAAKSTANTKVQYLEKNENSSYAFNNWQYLDSYVAWGGSSDEGSVVIPQASWINAAHKNGTKMLGALFFPPNKFGGDVNEFIDFLEPTIADQLIDMAKYYGFDGWYINPETEMSGSSFYNSFVKFMKYFGPKAMKAGLSVELYGSASSAGIPYYHGVDSKNIDLMYDSVTKQKLLSKFSADYHVGFGESTKILQDNNMNPWKDITYGYDFGTGDFGPSLKNSLIGTIGKDANNPKANAVSSFTYKYNEHVGNSRANQQKFFTSSSWDVRSKLKKDNEWSSMNNFYVERTPLIDRQTFSTSFNQGLGSGYYLEGNKVILPQGRRGYLNMGTQDILPTYRWWVDVKDSSGTVISDPDVSANPNNIKPYIGNDDVYNGSNSLEYTGTLKQTNSFENKLYGSDIKLKTGDSFSMTYKGKEPELLVWGENQSTTSIKGKGAFDSNGWTTVRYEVPSSLDGKVMKAFGTKITNNENQDWDTSEQFLGQLTFKPSNVKSQESKIKNITLGGIFKSSDHITEKNSKYHAMRLYWEDMDKTDSLKSHMFYVVKKDGTKELKAISTSYGAFIPEYSDDDLIDKDGEKYLSVECRTISNEYKETNIQKILIKV